MRVSLLIATLLISLINNDSVRSQFLLPHATRDAPKPTVPPELADYFSINPGGGIIQTLFPGLVPPANFEVAGQPNLANLANILSNGGGIGDGLQIQRLTNSVGSGGGGGGGGGNSDAALNAFLAGKNIIKNNRGGEDDGNSSISGIPNIFPALPKSPFPSSTLPGGQLGAFPGFSGGSGITPDTLSALLGQQSLAGLTPTPFSPLSLQGLSGIGGSSLGSLSGISNFNTNNIPVAAPPQSDNLLTQLIRSLGLGDFAQNLDNVNQVLNLNTQGNDALSNVLYSALTDSSAQTKDKSQQTALTSRSNAAVIQNLLSQPGSPFCNPVTPTVQGLNLSSFVGKYYQVLYSPPMSLGPCSMIAFSKLSDVGNGGPGTVMNIFEYTSQQTPNGRPKVSSGYAIIRAPGEMIFRTSNNPADLNVYIISNGPTSDSGQYEYIVLTINCQYPLYVYARDPVLYKQKYEGEVNSLLEQRGLATSWARLFNIVAPVDYNLCTFPPTLFNVQGK